MTGFADFEQIGLFSLDLVTLTLLTLIAFDILVDCQHSIYLFFLNQRLNFHWQSYDGMIFFLTHSHCCSAFWILSMPDLQ